MIGNPPFGRQSCLARRFIRKCGEFADVIAFVLPRSFKKPSMQAAFARPFHLVRSRDLPKNAFLVDGRPHDVPCVFQIWERRATDRPRPPRAVPDAAKFAYARGPDGGARALPARRRQRGAVRLGRLAAMAADARVSACSPSSHYFLRFVAGAASAAAAVARYAAARGEAALFEHNNTVGARSISKQELTRMLNAAL